MRIKSLFIITALFGCNKPNEDFTKGISKAELGDYRGAIVDFNNAIESDSNNIEAYYYRGQANTAITNYREAIEDFNRIILELKPNYPKAYLGRGITMSKIDEPYNALADFEKAIELDPNFAEAYCYRGITKIGLGQKDEGCLDLSKAGELGYEFAYLAINRLCN